MLDNEIDKTIQKNTKFWDIIFDVEKNPKFWDVICLITVSIKKTKILRFYLQYITKTNKSIVGILK